MRVALALRRVFSHERVNFLLTNRIPRRWATLFMGWYSRRRMWPVPQLSLFLWRLFGEDLRLFEARDTRFPTLHDCFIRQLRPGARPVDGRRGLLTSPCDAIVGAHGSLRGVEAIQAKGFPYSLYDLLGNDDLVRRMHNGGFVTLRLKASMYHRFHAPAEGALTGVNYISGDTWNVNPIAIRRIERLFCKNERVVLRYQLSDCEDQLVMVPVAAILVASIRLHALGETFHLRYRGSNHFHCNVHYRKGQELGYFHHGSTIIMFFPPHYRFASQVTEGRVIRMGQPLLERTTASPLSASPATPSSG